MYVSIYNDANIVLNILEDNTASWSDLWKEANSVFEDKFLMGDNLAYLSDKMFFVWEVTTCSLLGGGTSTNFMPTISTGTSPLTTSWLIPTTPLICSSMLWMISTGTCLWHVRFHCCICISIFIYHSFLPLLLLGPLSLTIVRPTFLLNFSAFAQFGKMELIDFKDLISIVDYKICEEAKKKNPIWYKLTMDIFIKFLYKVFLCLSIPCPFIYLHI